MSLYRTKADDILPVPMTDKCVILDLDQTLIATQEDSKSIKKLGILSDPKLISLRDRCYYFTIEDLGKPGQGTKYDFWGVTRPHIDEFLIFCFSYFKIVAVWSAGKRPYVEAIVDHIFRDLRPPHLIYTHDDIITGPGGYVEKPLLKMIDHNKIFRNNMSLNNSLAIDDNPSTFSRNIGNGVLIPEYNPQLTIQSLQADDQALIQLMKWLMQPEVMKAKDVTVLDKNKIFI